MDIGRKIRKLRMRRGLKAGELARLLGVSKSYISRIEREHRRINTDLLERIGQILEVPPSVLVGGNEEEGAHALSKESEAVLTLLLEENLINPRFVDEAVSWLAEVAFPEDGNFDTAGTWDENFLETLGGEDGCFRRLLARFQEIRSRILPLNPRPASPYSRFREGAIASIKGLSEGEKTDLVASLLPSLLRNRPRWPARLRELPPLLSNRDPEASKAGAHLLRFPGLDMENGGSGNIGPVTLIPGEDLDQLRAIRIEDASMSPKYEPGDVVVYSTARKARSGERAAVGLADGTWACRIYRRRGSMVQLVPLNPLFEPHFLEPGDVAWAHPIVRSLSD